MANEIVTEIRVELDKFRADLKTAAADSKTAGDKIGSTFSGVVGNKLEDAASLAKTSFYAVAGVAATVGVAFAAAVKSIHMAEEIEAVGRQFDILADKAGISGAALSAGLARASGGLIGTTELMQSANKALIEMGGSAERLPEVMELARKATAVFGGSLQANFEAMNQSIINTNTKGLKNLGIVIDQDKAYKDFAATLGVSATALSQAGRQQALLEAALLKGRTAFSGVEVGTAQLSDSYTRMKVAVNDAVEAIAISFKNLSAGVTGGLFQGITNAAKTVSDNLTASFGGAVESAAAEQRLLTAEITHWEDELKSIAGSPWQETIYGGLFQQKLSNARLALSLLNEEQRKHGTLLREQAAETPQNAPTAEPPVLIDVKALQQQQAEYSAVLAQHYQSRIDAQKANASTEAEFNQLTKDSQGVVEAQYYLSLEALQRKYLDTHQITQAQFDEIAIQMETEKNNKLKTLADNNAGSMLKTFSDIGKAAQATLGQGLANSFSAMGAAMAKGQNGFEAFGKAMIGVFGDIAVQAGSTFIGIGIGKAVASGGTDPTAYALIGAGSALAILGGALKAYAGMSGGGPATGSAPSANGGGVAAGGGGGFAPVETQATTFNNEQERKDVGTAVTVNVQGNVFDRRETGMHIADVINETFGSNGITFATSGNA
jgi:hypothetical protein